MFTVERLLPKNIKLSVTYFHSRSSRMMRVVNINAPLGGTFIPGDPDSGVRPLGNEAGNIFEYQSTGRLIGNTLSFNVNGNLKALSFWGGYNLSKARNTDQGASGSPFDAYDFSQEWARAQWGSLSFMYGGGSYQAPHGFSVNMFMLASSGQPFNIITGEDTNGDTFFTERPAFATDLNKPGVVVTPLGAFDPNPDARADDHSAKFRTWTRLRHRELEPREGVQVWTSHRTQNTAAGRRAENDRCAAQHKRRHRSNQCNVLTH